MKINGEYNTQHQFGNFIMNNSIYGVMGKIKDTFCDRRETLRTSSNIMYDFNPLRRNCCSLSGNRGYRLCTCEDDIIDEVENICDNLTSEHEINLYCPPVSSEGTVGYFFPNYTNYTCGRFYFSDQQPVETRRCEVQFVLR